MHAMCIVSADWAVCPADALTYCTGVTFPVHQTDGHKQRQKVGTRELSFQRFMMPTRVQCGGGGYGYWWVCGSTAHPGTCTEHGRCSYLESAHQDCPLPVAEDHVAVPAQAAGAACWGLSGWDATDSSAS
jgi:hypothetical protein